MKTNLDKVKDIAITFLYLDPKYKDVKLSMFIAHPFFDSCILMDYKTHTLYNLFEDTETFEKNRVFIKELIKKETSVQSLFLMICKPYQLTFLNIFKSTYQKKILQNYLYQVGLSQNLILMIKM